MAAEPLIAAEYQIGDQVEKSETSGLATWARLVTIRVAS